MVMQPGMLLCSPRHSDTRDEPARSHRAASTGLVL